MKSSGILTEENEYRGICSEYSNSDTCEARGGSAASGRGTLVSAPPLALAQRHCSCRPFSHRALHLECVCDAWSWSVRQAGRTTLRLSFCLLSGAVRNLAAHSLSLVVWLLHLILLRNQRCGLSLGRQFHVHCAALDRRHRLLLHGLAHLASALQRCAYPHLSRSGLRQSAK